MILDRGQRLQPTAPSGGGKQGAAAPDAKSEHANDTAAVPRGDVANKGATSGFAIRTTVGSSNLDLKDATRGLVGNGASAGVNGGSTGAAVSGAASMSTRADSSIGDGAAPTIGAVTTTVDPIGSNNLNSSGTTTPLGSTVEAVTAPLATTSSTVTAPIAATTSAVTAPVTSTTTNLLTTTTSTVGGALGGLLKR
jgi:hypothetical protein